MLSAPRREPRLRLVRRGSRASAAVPAWSAYSMKVAAGAASFLVCTISSSGFFSHSEPSMLRMNEDTRVLDCATPSKLELLAVLLHAR